MSICGKSSSITAVVGYDSGMRYILCSLAFFAVIPLTSFAAPEDIQGFGNALLTFLNSTVVSFLLTLALLVFVYNVIRYFIIDKDSFGKRAVARRYMIWSISGFVLIVSIWGVVNLLVFGTGLNRSTSICPDSIPLSECTKWNVER